MVVSGRVFWQKILQILCNAARNLFRRDEWCCTELPHTTGLAPDIQQHRGRTETCRYDLSARKGLAFAVSFPGCFHDSLFVVVFGRAFSPTGSCRRHDLYSGSNASGNTGISGTLRGGLPKSSPPKYSDKKSEAVTAPYRHLLCPPVWGQIHL